MNQQIQGQQLFEYGNEKKNPQIGTQILDPTMPSDIDFDQKKPQQDKQLQGSSIAEVSKQKGKIKIASFQEIKSFTVKGKPKVQKQSKYKCASYTNLHIQNTFEVKAYDQQKSGGLKSVWQSIVGYTKRQLLIQDGYIYIFEKTKQGYLTHAVLNLGDLFKIFSDVEQSKVRLVFHFDKEHLKNKNFQVKSCEQFVQKIAEEASKIGLVVIAQ